MTPFVVSTWCQIYHTTAFYLLERLAIVPLIFIIIFCETTTLYPFSPIFYHMHCSFYRTWMVKIQICGLNLQHMHGVGALNWQATCECNYTYIYTYIISLQFSDSLITFCTLPTSHSPLSLLKAFNLTKPACVSFRSSLVSFYIFGTSIFKTKP